VGHTEVNTASQSMILTNATLYTTENKWSLC